jgi:hypothetical protein
VWRAGRAARVAVRSAVGDATFELLVAYLAFIRTAHYFCPFKKRPAGGSESSC